MTLETPTSEFMYSVFVEKNVKQLVEEQLIWEPLLTKQAVNALNVRYYREQYVDIETPNDVSMNRPIDSTLKSPVYRAPGATFAHTAYGEPKEYNLGLRQIALEIDVPDETQKYVEMENVILRSQKKLANAMASFVNNALGNALSENWTGSTINVYTASATWSNQTASACRPIADIINAQEMVEDVPGYAYKASSLIISKQSMFDLMIWMAEHSYQYGIEKPTNETEIIKVAGIKVIGSNMAKRGTGLMADFKEAGVLFEAEPLSVKTYYVDQNRTTNIQATRTFGFALTDAKAVCLLKSLA